MAVAPLREPREDRILPEDIEIEQSLLGALLIQNNIYEQIAAILTAQDFSHELHGRIFHAIGSLIGAGHPATPIALKMYFTKDEMLTAHGGVNYLARLVVAAVTIVNAPFYAQQIVELSRRRQLIGACLALLDSAYVVEINQPVSALIEAHERQLVDLHDHGAGSAARSLGQAVQESLAATEGAYKAGGKLVGLSTGLVDLDRKIGGLMPGNLEMIAGRPSLGKSSLACGIALHLATHAESVLIFSLEETAAQQAQRMLAERSGIAADRQRRGDVDMIHWEGLVDAAGRLSSLPLYIDDTPGLTISEIRNRARDMKRRFNIKLVIVDHIQLIRFGASRAENRNLEIGEITRSLKELAKALDIPVLALSQLSRAVEQRDSKRPILGDLRDSGEIEANADSVIFVYRQEHYLVKDEPERRASETDEKFNDRHDVWRQACERAHGLAELLVAKRRGGAIGTVKCYWDAELTSFRNLANTYE